jgi:hypothetical protein
VKNCGSRWGGWALKFLRVRLGRVIRDIRRKIAGNELLEERFADSQGAEKLSGCLTR